MPERQVSADNLRTGAFIGGWMLTGWAVLGVILALTDRTQIGTTVADMGISHWAIPSVLVCVAVLQLWGHAAYSRPILIAGDLLGGLACAFAASILGWATMHGAAAAVAALNWAFIATQFLLHTIMLRQKQQHP